VRKFFSLKLPDRDLESLKEPSGWLDVLGGAVEHSRMFRREKGPCLFPPPPRPLVGRPRSPVPILGFPLSGCCLFSPSPSQGRLAALDGLYFSVPCFPDGFLRACELVSGLVSNVLAAFFFSPPLCRSSVPFLSEVAFVSRRCLPAPFFFFGTKTETLS